MVDPDKISSHSLTVVWPQLTDQVQIEVNGILHDGIDGNSFTFHELVPNTRYTLRLRYVAGNKVSEWSDPFGAITKPDPMNYQGDPVEVNVELSNDGVNFKPYGDHLTWKSDSKNKVVGLRNVDAKAIRLKVYKSSGPFVAAKEVIFFRDKK